MPLNGGPAFQAPQRRTALNASPGSTGVGSEAGRSLSPNATSGPSLGTVTGEVGAAGANLLNYYNSYMASQAPTIAGFQADSALAGANLGLVNSNYGAQRGFANRDYDLGVRENNLGYASLGLDREANNLKLADYQLDRQNVGIDRRGVGVTQDYINKMRGFAGDTLSQQLYDAMRQGVYRTVQNNSQATANGAWFAPMRQFENQNIYGDTMNAGNQARTGYNKQIAGFDRDSANANLDLERLDVREKGIDNDEQRVATANRQLDIQAQKLGLNSEQLRLALDKGLQNLGVQNATSVNQIMAGLASNNAQVQQVAFNAMAQAVQAAELDRRSLGSVSSQVYPYLGSSLANAVGAYG